MAHSSLLLTARTRGALIAALLLASCAGGGDAPPVPTVAGGPVAAPAGDPAAMPAPSAALLDSAGAAVEPAFTVRPVTRPESATGPAASDLAADLTDLALTVGGRRAQMRTLYRSNAREVEVFHGTRSAIEARLHLGTVAQNPVLISQWNEAQTALDQIAWNLTGLSAVSEDLDADIAALRAIRREAQRLQQAPGLGEGDRLALTLLRDDVTAGLGIAQGLQANALEEMGRHGALLILQRDAMLGLRAAIVEGDLIAASPNALPSPYLPDLAPDGAVTFDGVPALTMVRFDRPNISYEARLSETIADTLAADPAVEFTLLAVAPLSEDAAAQQRLTAAAQQYAQAVRRSLTRFGVAPNQISLAYTRRASADASEVYVFAQ